VLAVVVRGVLKLEQPTRRRQTAAKTANLRLPVCPVELDVGAIGESLLLDSQFEQRKYTTLSPWTTLFAHANEMKAEAFPRHG
jgi:hypothetical protein